MTLTVSRKALDTAGLRFRDRCEVVGDRGLLQDYRVFRSDDLAQGFHVISVAIAGQPVVLSGRLKRTDTLIRKLRRERTMKLTFMADVVGFRILATCPNVQRTVLDMICSSLPVKSVKDYINAPPESGYQGIHITCQVPRTFPGNREPSSLTVEIQMRTHFQHFWSTTSESMGEQVKEGGGTVEQRTELAILAEKVRTFELNNPAFAQMETLPNSLAPVYMVMNYDKSKGRTVMTQNFGGDLARALEYYKYLEDYLSQNLNSEIVLLTSSEAARLPISHTRYYSPRGRPETPRELSD